MQIPWYIAALGAALCWGLHYPLVSFALQRVSLYSVLLLTTVPILLLAPLFSTRVANDWHHLRALPAHEQWSIAAIMLTSLAGAVFVFVAIGGKNATLASLIEISYPIFVVFFSYVLFKQVHINPSVIFGGLLVIAGTSLIIYHNQ